jgi:inner membrane protein
MESVTHIVLGAVMGEVIAGKKLGKKAMLFGAIAQSIPDFDFIAGLWMLPDSYFLAHRGLTHSFFFVIVASIVTAFLLNRFHSSQIGLRRWMLFLFLELLAHILLDSLNAYGVAWLEPFSHQRFSFDLLFVVDPFFTVWPCIVCVALLLLKSSSAVRMKWAVTGILLGGLYIIYAMSNKSKAVDEVNASLKQQRIAAQEFLITPTPLNTWLWYVVAKTNDGYWIGYYSDFDSKPISYHYFQSNDSLLSPHQPLNGEVNRLIRFSRGYHLFSQKNDTVVFSNLRFSQMFGWEKPEASFVFQYNLGKPNSLFTVQRGRFSDWDPQRLLNFIIRIKGN